VRRTSSIVFNANHFTFATGILLYPVYARLRRRQSHTAPHRLDNQIRFLPTPLQTRHYAQTEFPLHFVPETTFHPLEIARRIYLFLFFPTPNFPSAVTILSRHDHFHTTAFLRILLFLRGKKKFCSSVNEPHTIRTLLRFASLNIAFHKMRVTAYTTVSNNRFMGLLIF